MELCGHATLASAYVIAQHVDPGGTTHFYVRRRGDAEQTRVDFEPASPVKAGYEHWADAVAGRAEYRFSNEERLGNVAILEAVVESAEAGAPVAVAPQLGTNSAGPKSGFHLGSFRRLAKPSYSPLRTWGSLRR